MTAAAQYGKMTKKVKLKFSLWLILGIAFVLYYLIEALFVGFGFSLLWLWAAGGCVCLLCAALTKRYGRLPLPKWLFRVICVMLTLILALFFFLEGCIFTQFSADGESELDYIVVLGAKVRAGGVPSKPLYWRINAAEEYLRENPDTVAILSGGKGADEPMSEAQCMYNVLSSRGIDKSRLILEDQSTNTNENIRNSLNMMDENASFGVVTNNFHVFRAVKIAETVSGRKVSGISAEYKDALWLHYMAREAVGIFKDTLLGNMKF